MKLYWHPFSLFPWRVRIALHEKGLPYEEVLTDLSQPREQGFLELNPFGQIPVLEDDGLVVAESMAILEYLDEKVPLPALMPADARSRATARKLMCWSTDYWAAPWKQWMAARLPDEGGATGSEASAAEGRAELCHHLDVLEPYLADQAWLVGDYSLADVCYAPLVLLLDGVGFGDGFSSRPGVARWIERLRERPAIQEAMLAR